MIDDLVQECAGASDWPTNLLSSSHNRSLLRDIYSQLQHRSLRLFIPDGINARVELMEVLTGNTQYQCKTLENKHELETHLQQHLVGKEKDPLVRYLFLNAEHSRARLNCTLPMFAYICTYHHVLPEFTDLVYTFGQSNIDDASHTRFIRADEQFEGIPELSRSDRQSRIAYKLFAMEKSDFDGRWTMTQTAAYHSLDLINGRIFWLILKANDVIEKRIKEDDANERQHPTGIPTSLEESLKASLKKHMILLDWSCEGWRWYITQLEQQAKPDLIKAIAAPIPSDTSTLDPFAVKLSLSDFPRSEISGMTPRTGRSCSSFRTDSSPNASATQVAADFVSDTERNIQAQIGETRQLLSILRDFSLGGIQSLTSILSKVDEAKTAMLMNIRMSEDLRSYYQDILEFEQLDKTVTDACASAHRQFERRARSLERLLEMECLRADALAKRIRAHTTLYNTILQAENRGIEKLFSMNTQVSSERIANTSRWMATMAERMYDIAKTTDKDAASMHVITFFTLIFLPGTFLSAFFSTPIFGDEAVGSSWSFDNQLFIFFLEICVPMMVLTITVWVLFMTYKSKKRARAEIERNRNENGIDLV